MQLGCGDGFVCTNDSYGERSLDAKEDASGTSFNSDEDRHDISDLDARMTMQHGSQDSKANTEAKKGSLSIDLEISVERINVGVEQDCRGNGAATEKNPRRQAAGLTVSIQ